jgi:hypothetical protein
VCPACGMSQYPGVTAAKLVKAKRNEEIAYRLGLGAHTLEDLAKIYGVTRERVRQIYVRETGKQWHQVKNTLKRHQPKIYCLWCGIEIIGQRRKFCTPRHKIKYWAVKRDITITYICTFCGKKFHPYRTSKYGYLKKPVKNHFCSTTCNMRFLARLRPNPGLLHSIVMPYLIKMGAVGKGGEILNNMKSFGELTEAEKKEAFLFVVRYWGKMTQTEMAQKLGLKIFVLGTMAARLRKAGIDLPKMSRGLVLTPSFIDELKSTFAQR